MSGAEEVSSGHFHSRIVVLICADAEWLPTKRVLNPERVEWSPYGEYFAQVVAGESVVFFQGGWGKVAAAASTDYVIERWHPELLVNLGTCGGIEGRVHRGEKLLASRTVTYDIYETMGDSDEAIRAHTTDIDLTWLEGPLPFGVRVAPLVSGDRDLVPSEVDGLVRRFDAVAGDWESDAIAWVANRRSTRLLILRAVSDLVGPAGGETIANASLFQKEAERIMRDLLVELVKVILYTQRLRKGAVHARPKE